MSSGNTTNLIGHIRNVHKAAYFDCFTKQKCTLVADKSKSKSISTERISVQSLSSPKQSSSGNNEQEHEYELRSGATASTSTTIPFIDTATSSTDIQVSKSNANANPNELMINQALTQTFNEGACERNHIASTSSSDIVPSVSITPIRQQKTIVSTFEDISAYSESGAKTRKLNNCLLYMICKDNQPFSIVENEGFKNLMKAVAPQYKVPSRTSLRRWLDAKYEAISETFKTKLSSIENITLTTDIWSDTLNMKSFLGVTAHFGVETELFSVTLGVYELDQRHTSQYIAEMLLATCQDWGLDKEHLTAVVTDNAANMVKAVELAFGKSKHISCFAHTLNLVAEGTMACDKWQSIVKKIKTIVTWFKQSCIASDELRKATSAETKLVQSVPTRWNSTYYMVQRLLELRTVVNDILFRHTNAPSMLSGSEISVASQVLHILRPLEAVTKEISGDKYCTSSKIIPLVRCMRSNITSAVTEESVAKEVQKLALQEINKRMGAIESVTPLAISNILDPRFKKMHFNDALACENAIGKIKELMQLQLNSNEDMESDSDKSDKGGETSFSLWTDHHKLVHRNWKTNKSEESVSDELSIYLRTPVGRLNENPLEIWRDYRIQFPKLYKIAFKYLTIVGTSVPSERLFSHAAQVMNQQRNRLKGKRLNKILFLQSIEKKYWDF